VTLGGVGHAQRRLANFIETSKVLPGWVIWTTHERSAEDKLTNVKVIGPEVIGGAMTPNLSRVFNNTLHFTTAEKKAKVKDEHTGAAVDELDVEYRIYTRDHFRPEGNTYVKYRAVTRHPDPTGKKFPLPDGKPAPALELYCVADVPGQSIIDIYESISAAHKREQAALRKAA